MAVIELTADNFQDEALDRPEPTLVDFTAVWCGPCRRIAPIVDELAQEFDGQVRFGKVDIDQHSMLASQYGVMAVPTLIVFKGGEPVFRQVGWASKESLAAKLREIVQAPT